jgi:hypothetical protein
MTHEERDQMIAELEHAEDLFRQVDVNLTAFTRKIMGSFNVLEHMPEIMREAQDRMGFGESLPGLT